MGVVIVTWHIPAQQPANISFNTVNLLLTTRDAWTELKGEGGTGVECPAVSNLQ